MYALTDMQLKTLAILEREVTEYGIAPSYEELMGELGLSSKSGVHRLVHALVKRGRIELIPNHARTIRIVSGLTDGERARLKRNS